ncbi:MAG TPA: ChbG/HpnK family deacetylase [Candidatus Eisenbacteria bacterium]|nr:ChbG/HpnK family deacetylase [Candidatus Eisenbacteria bacterium]
MKIIVNADDLGLSESVNEAIFHGMQRNVITSATLLANGVALESAVRELQRFPKHSFGVHLNLTEFEPVHPASKKNLARIIDERGCFAGNAIRQAKIDIHMLRAIFQEWCSQIEKLVTLGVEPSHLDAHHHVHTIPQLLPVLVALRRRYKINKIRISRNMYDDAEHPGSLMLGKKKVFNSALRTFGFRTVHVFTDLLTFIELCAVCPPKAGTAELMTHPGSTSVNEEMSVLGGAWPELLQYPAALISYKTL